jgi:hypothetical protein
VAEKMCNLSATDGKETSHRDSLLPLRKVPLEGLAFSSVHEGCGTGRLQELLGVFGYVALAEDGVAGNQ